MKNIKIKNILLFAMVTLLCGTQTHAPFIKNKVVRDSVQAVSGAALAGGVIAGGLGAAYLTTKAAVANTGFGTGYLNFRDFITGRYISTHKTGTDVKDELDDKDIDSAQAKYDATTIPKDRSGKNIYGEARGLGILPKPEPVVPEPKPGENFAKSEELDQKKEETINTYKDLDPEGELGGEPLKKTAPPKQDWNSQEWGNEPKYDYDDVDILNGPGSLNAQINKKESKKKSKKKSEKESDVKKNEQGDENEEQTSQKTGGGTTQKPGGTTDKTSAQGGGADGQGAGVDVKSGAQVGADGTTNVPANDSIFGVATDA